MPISESHNIDCLEFMRKFPDKHFELAIVDPPYGINAPNMQMGTHTTRKGDGYPGISVATRFRKARLSTGGGHFSGKNLTTMNCEWDNEKPSPEYFTELFRVSINQIIWGGNYFDLPPTRCILCWDKMQSWDNFSQFELAWTSFDSPAKLFRLSNRGGTNDENKIHPTQKPVRLYKWALHHYAKPGNKILDTHLGSGSSRIASYDMGFDFYGTEIDQQYFQAEQKRFRLHSSQQSLFAL